MTRNKARVLIVDDEIYIREILKSTLDDAGYECDTVGSAEAALTALAAQAFDIAFVDIRMPGKQGTELLQEIKAGYPEVIVIMITAIDSANTAIESMRMGAYDYIIKPFNLDQVLVSANRALDKRRLENANREYQKYLQQIADERAAETRRLFYSMTQVFIHLLDMKTPFNEGHSQRVAEIARYVARELRMTDDGVRKVYLAALLHDVGMILVEDMLLNKEGSLTADELRRIQERTASADEVLRPILDDEEVLKCIRHYREWYDGTGYPGGLKGNLIPLGARVIAVVEAFDAITSGRPYRLPRSPQEAINELTRCAQTQFDPQVVTVFAELYERIFQDLSQFPKGHP
ncbi:MAG: response regulator [Acidobacteria bacterium]|nr:response regulator [Acidobacteriota bacterium]